MGEESVTELAIPRPRATPTPTPRSEHDAAVEAFATTLRNAELARIRRVVPFMLGLAVAGAALVPIAGGAPQAIRVAYIGIGMGIAAIAYLYWLTRATERFTERRLAVVHGLSITAVFAAVYYWGIFSPAAAIVALGIFFVTLGRSPRISVGLYAWAAVCQAVLAALVIGNVIDDVGLVTADRSSVNERVTEQIMIQLVFAVSYLIARATRSQLDRAVGEHDRAVRAVAQGEALLVEARQDLDRALKIGGAGRYSDNVVGNYRLGVVLGRGGMGDVYEAVHVETGAPAAVKLLNATALATPEYEARFYREAEAATKLQSPHIVRLLDVSTKESGLPYLAMERLRGQDLAQILRERQLLPLDEIVRLVREVATGLEAARVAGIVHRDIKPQNLFRAELGGSTRLWKILDFGVSKLADRDGTLTRTHAIGTPMYMAPEQARGSSIDHRADVFSLATVCYRAVTGHPPYGGRDVPSILYGVVHRMPPRPSALARLPRDLDRVIAVGMAKAAEDRFATALELADAFTAAASGALAAALRERCDAMIAARPWDSER